MERNLVKHGESTLMVSVPAVWARRHNLTKGDSVEILDQGETLVVHRKGWKKETMTKEITFEEDDYDTIRGILCKAYRQGVDLINANYPNDEIFKTIHKVVSSIFGYEITSNEKGMCTIRHLIKEFDFDTKTAFKKVALNVNHMFNTTRDILTNKLKFDMERINLLRDEGRKFRDIAYQMLKKETIGNAFTEAHIIHITEQNATYLSWLIKSYEKHKPKKLSKEFLNLFDKIHEYFTDSLIFMTKKDTEYIKFVMKKRKELLIDCEKIAAKRGLEAELVIYLAMLVQNIHNPKSVIIA